MKKVQWLFVVTAVSLLFSLAAGCTQPTPTASATPTVPPVVATTEAPVEQATAAFPVTIKDAVGREVVLDQAPQRIVIAGKSSTLIMDAVYMFPEAVDRVVSYGLGTQTGKNFLTVVDPKLDSKTGLENTVSAEQIAPLKPDLVILKDFLKDSLGTPLEALGIKVVYLNLETPETFNTDVRTIGQIFGNSQRADEIVAYYASSVAAVTTPLKDLKEADRPSVLLMQYSAKGGSVAFKVSPELWLQTDLVKLAGGTPVWLDASTPDGWAVVTLEQIAAWNPDMIFLIDYSGNADKDVAQLKTDAQWSVLNAVKNAHLYAFPSDFLSWDQPDPRWTLGLSWLASKIQPSLAPAFDVNNQVTQFYKTIYQLDDSTITGKIIPLLKVE